MIWLWTLQWAFASDLKAGLGACDDGDLRGALEPLDLALVDPGKVKAKLRGDAQLCRARAILQLPDEGRAARLDQAAMDLVAAMAVGVEGETLDVARQDVADLLLTRVLGAFQPGGTDADRAAAVRVLEQSLDLWDTPLGHALAVKALLGSDLDAAVIHAKAGLALPAMAAEDVSLALISLSPVPELLDVERHAEAAEILALASAVAPKMKADAEARAQADAMLASLRAQVALGGPDTSAADLVALAADAPDSYPLLATLGGRLLEVGEEEVAVKVLARAEAADPTRSEVPYNLGVHYINQAARLVEADPNAVDLEAKVMALMGKARPALERASAAAPADAAPLKALVEVCGHLEDSACVARAEKALAALPTP